MDPVRRRVHGPGVSVFGSPILTYMYVLLYIKPTNLPILKIIFNNYSMSAHCLESTKYKQKK